MTIKICSVVMNSVSRDARVLKQADSLRGAGYEVAIVGTCDKNFPLMHEMLPAGVEIFRVELAHIRKFLLPLIKLAGLFVASSFVSIAIVLMSLSLQQILFWIAVMGMGGFMAAGWLLFSRSIENTAPVVDPVGRAKNRTSLLQMFSAGVIFWLRCVPMILVAMRLRPDVIHCHDIHALPVGVYVRFRTGCRLVYDAHEIYEELPQLDKTGRRRYRRVHWFCQRFVDEFITINDSIAKWSAEHYPRLPSATVIMNATRLTEVGVYDQRLHKAAGLPPETRILLYQGGYSTHRGLELLVESARFLPNGWCLVMMGWGNLEDHLRVLGERINADRGSATVGDAVRFIGPAAQNELAEWTQGATIGVIPYENTGLNHWFCTPNKLWEYPNAGVPILVSPFPEMRRFVEAYGHGWLLPERMMVESLGKFISNLDDSKIAEARANAKRFIDDNNWHIFEQRLISAYDRLIKRANG